ncbi:PIN domain-containing protein [Rhodopseudomonas sp. B29]|uniref:PIN domain-containing protein n=1 Tax=Rhodopseudomonas sp. B29 TaxID=95607 RepID=UPI0003B575E4|nr:PIN domain-containing protein [Rhodopseudomonas sp. B29]
MKAFFDTDILVYTTTTDPRQRRAAACLDSGRVVSVQVLNEFVHVARRKLQRDWPSIETALAQFRAAVDEVLPITLDTHVAAVTLARDHHIQFYDALIVAAALEAGCDTLYSEDMQHGRRIGALRIEDPFIDMPR